MLYPHDIEQKLGFDKIRASLQGRCTGEQGKQNVTKIRFSFNKPLILKLSAQTEELMNLIRSGENIPSLNYPDVSGSLAKLHVEGVFLEAEEVVDIYKSLRIFLDWLTFLKNRRESLPEISVLVQNIELDERLIKKIDECIDEKGEIRGDATPELRKIRAEIQKNERVARRTLDKVMRETGKAGMSPEDSSLTVRNGRLVIPIKSEFKRSVKGFIHDASASGNIIFIEPADVLEVNNDLKELSYAEKREIIRILTKLTNEIRVYASEISRGDKVLGIIDLIKAKAIFSLEFDAVVPELRSDHVTEWINAVNPVLKKILEKQHKQIVPLNIRLDVHDRILLISGPNAGGKSVCLKTVGLLQYMYQCGIPVPMSEGSKAEIFKNIFIDIGDEQSIEDDLSTYSSHLKSMDFFMRNSRKGTLFLIDEFGSGTDPQFGGAIAEAILEELTASGGSGIITTHYNNLKKKADTEPGLINGRMRFDVKKLMPLYQLEIGKPGSSFALEIAGKIGLSKKLIKSAKTKVGTDAVELDRLLNELEEEKKFHEEQAKDLESRNSLLEKTIQNYKQLHEDISEKKKEILNEAKTEAKGLLKETNRRVEKLIRDIKEHKAEKEITKKSREEIRVFEKEIQPEIIKKKEREVNVIGGAIEAGSMVRLKGQDSVGEVIKVHKQDADVLFGDLKSKIKVNRLERISRSEVKKVKKENVSDIKGINLIDRKANFSPDLDVRGKRAEEALSTVGKFIDDSILFGVPVVRIIHGKGDGILREVLNEELKTYKEVRNTHEEHADRGGAGITVVEFR